MAETTKGVEKIHEFSLRLSFTKQFSRSENQHIKPLTVHH